MSGNEKLERELDALLGGDDSRLAALYRKLPKPEPDADVDAAVLAMARRHAMPIRARRPRWLAMVAAAAVVVIAAGVVWRIVPRMPQRGPGTIPQPQDAVRESAQVSGSSHAAKKALPHAAAELKPSPPAPPILPKTRTEQNGAVARSPQRLQSAPAPIPKPGMSTVPDTTNGFAPPTPSANTRSASSDATEPGQKSRQGTGIAAPPYSRALRNNARLYPESWLTAIRRLIREGKRDEAAQNLRLFHRTYPDYELPADLKDFQANTR